MTPPHASPPDDLLPRIAAGDPAAVSECVDRYGPVIRALCRRSLPHEADDLTQDVLIQLWRSAPSFDPELGSELTFVVTLARRKVIDRLRALGRRPTPSPLPDEPHLADTDDPAADSERADEIRQARQALQQLRSEEREVLTLTLVDGLSQSEVAQRTRMPLGTVKTHARRGLIRLRNLLVSLRSPAHASTGEVTR